MASAILRLLNNKLWFSWVSLELLLHPFSLMPNYQQEPIWLKAVCAFDYPLKQGGASQRL
jgi:hypothetical protein